MKARVLILDGDDIKSDESINAEGERFIFIVFPHGAYHVDTTDGKMCGVPRTLGNFHAEMVLSVQRGLGACEGIST